MKSKKAFQTVILAIAIFCLPFLASAHNRLLADFPSGKSVSRVNISETMLKLGTAMIPMGAVGPYAALIKDPKNMEIYSCSGDEKILNEANAKFSQILKSLDYDELLSAEEYGNISNIYLVFETDKKTDARQATAMIIYDANPLNLNIVVIHGTFNLDNLSQTVVVPEMLISWFF